MKNRRFSTVDREIQGYCPAFPASRAHLAQQGQQSLAGQPQIGQRKQRHDLPGILRQSAVTNLHETKLALHHTERVFNNRPHRRQHPVERFLFLGQFATGRLLGRRQNGQIAFLREVLNRPVRLVIAPITQGNTLVPVQAGFHHRDVRDLGGRAFDGVNQAALGINADMNTKGLPASR